MKKRFSLLLAALLILSFAACGNDTAALRAEIADLRERVAVLEHQLAALQDPAASAPADPPANDGIPAGFSDLQGKVYSVVREFKTSPAYIKVSADPNRIDVVSAIHFIAKVEGTPMQLILIDCEADRNMYGYDAACLLVDLSDGKVYDTKSLDAASYAGETATYEDLLTYVFNCHTSYRANGAAILFTDSEILTPLTEDELAEVNKALNA